LLKLSINLIEGAMSVKTELPDVQNTADSRGKAIQKVGIGGYGIPFTVKTPDGGVQHTVGVVSMYASLNEETKGVNMSRFSITIEKAVQHGAVSSDFIEEVVKVLKERMGSTDSYVKVKFPYFIKKKAPVSGCESHLKIDCELEGRSFGAAVEKYLTVTVPYTSLCPCSKEMSLSDAPVAAVAEFDLRSMKCVDQRTGRGAHNQRSSCKITVHLVGQVWIEELVDIVEACASSPIWNTLKRADEKYVTERAYSNPRFVEDMVREVSLRLDGVVTDGRTDDYLIISTHEEAIHTGNAVAVLKGGRCLIP
jgi:GTP cyclohydrolase I